MIAACAALSRESLAAALEDIGRAKVAMIGDLCLDLYWTADMRLSELSRETPHHPLPVVAERFSPGGAGNVACNIAALKPKSLTAIGLVGTDWRGDLLRKALGESGVDCRFVKTSDSVVTNTYIKPIRTGISHVAYEDPRIDFENRAPISAELEDQLCAALNEADFDVLLVSDQMKFGCVTKKVRERICEIGASGKTVVVDSRDRAGEYRHVIVKPNEVEAARCFGQGERLDAADPKAVFDFAARIIGEISARNGAPAIITLGEQGCMIFDGTARHCPANRVEPPVDIVGAGDAFLAAFGCALASGANLDTAARIAALASSVTVKKIGTTGTASREEILAAFEASEH